MKFKTFLSTLAVSAVFLFTACDDDLNSIGNNIQPGGDDVELKPDTVVITAETVSFEDKIYAQTEFGTLGKYTDPILGTVKSDYLCEFYTASDLTFKDNFERIDSLSLDIVFETYSGDPNATMGLTAYELTSNLDKNWYTNIDATSYCDMTKPLGKTAYTIKSMPVSNYMRTLSLKLDKEDIGKRIYNKWLENPEYLKDSKKFRDNILKGVYVTTDYGSGSLIDVSYTFLNLYYSYWGKKVTDTEIDSLYTYSMRLSVVSDIIQLNRIQNTDLSSLTNNSDPNKAYMKSPAGVYTQLTVPIGEIAEKRKNGNYTVLNSANFKLKGFTEEEVGIGLKRPSTLLMVNKDSIENFFESNNKVDNITSMVISRDTTSNTYSFGNMALTIDYYIDQLSKDGKTIQPSDVLKFYLIPVEYKSSTNSSGVTETWVYNTMRPTGAIFRTDEKNMKMSLIQSKYSSQ